ncbi:MAG: threonine synthase [Euryarchaeota archaeon]|nr:threonine synthase [Euryarchaeota archaeon]
MNTYICTECGWKISTNEVQYLCPIDKSVLDICIDFINIDSTFWTDDTEGGWDKSIWRYGQVIPTDVPPDSSGIVRHLGGTPFFRCPAIEEKKGPTVFIKDDTVMPSGSLKDRASAVVVADAIARKYSGIITASTGNAGVALAAMGAAANIATIILVPRSTPQAKISQMIAYGGNVILVEGSYSEAFDLVIEIVDEHGIYCRNTAYNPLTIHGKKTVSYEIAEQLGSIACQSGAHTFIAPDVILVPVGDGNIISGVYYGFNDLLEMGLIKSIPKLYGVQVSGSNAVAASFRRGDESVKGIIASTKADSISADRPADGNRALRSVISSTGGFVTVDEDDIDNCVLQLASRTGVFAEKSASIVYGGLQILYEQGVVDETDKVVLLVTGNGLKTLNNKSEVELPTIDVNIGQLTEIISSII